MSSRTGRRRRTIPGYVSIEIASFRRIAASFKNDAEFGRWVKKAFDDMSIGCILDDTDPRIRAIYTEAFDRMEYEYNRKKEWEERKNKEKPENSETQATEESSAHRTEPERRPAAHQEQRQQVQPSATKAAVKKPEQVVWGKFENVYLSQDEYNELARLVGNLNTAREMVDSLSAKLEDGSITSSNHYATLVYWANYRKNHPAEQKTFAERDADRQIQTLKRLGVVPNEFFNN